jgi:hypothetical protein
MTRKEGLITVGTSNKKSSNRRRSKASQLVVITITPKKGCPPSVDPSTATVHAGDTIQWKCSGCDVGDWWIVKVEPNDSVHDASGQFVFYPAHSTNPAHDTTAPVVYTGPNIIKYTVATEGGVLDPHIIPMP